MFALLDIGGTKTRIAVSHDAQAFASDPIKIDTPHTYDTGIRTLIEAVQKHAQGERIDTVVAGVAGPLDHATGTLIASPHLTDWVGKPIRDTLQHALGADHVVLENDTALVGLGEAHFGAGKGDRIMAYITVSTGVGGVRIVEGSIDRSTRGFEPGHQIIDIDKTYYPSLAAHDVEDMLSGTATAKRFGKPAYEVYEPDVWEDLATVLATTLNNTIVHWSPDSVVLGGSMIVGNPAISVERTAFHLEKICTIFPTKPPLKRALLQDVGGLYGAMARARATGERQ